MTETPEHAAAAALRDAARTLAVARTCMWDRGVVVTAPPLTRATSSRPADPTADAALDERRLALREAVIGLEGAMTVAVQRLADGTDKVQAALTAWEGHTGEDD